MTFMRDRTYFDPQSGSIMDLPETMLTKRGEEVRLRAKAAIWHSRNQTSWGDAPAAPVDEPAAEVSIPVTGHPDFAEWDASLVEKARAAADWASEKMSAASVESAPAAQESRDLQPGETSIVVETLTGERRELVFPAPKQHRLDPPVESTPIIVTSGDGRKVEIDENGRWLEDEYAPHRYGEKWNRPGEYAAYRERVEAQFSAPVPQAGEIERAISVVISGFDGVGKSTVGRIIAAALLPYGISVSLSGQRACAGIIGDEVNWPRDPMSVEIWEIDRSSPLNH